MTDGSRYPGILFDLDGTLIDSTALILKSYEHTLQHFGVAVPDEATILAGFGTPLRDNLIRLNPGAGPDAVDRMMEVYSDFNSAHHDAMVMPFSGARELVEALHRAGARLAIVTGKRAHYAYMGLRHCGLSSFFEVVITPESTTRHKPSADPARAALAALGVAPDRSLFVGDSPHDIGCGRAAGTATAGALWGPNPQALRGAKPDYLCASLDEVATLVFGTSRTG